MKKSDLKTLTLMQSEQSQESSLLLVLTLLMVLMCGRVQASHWQHQTSFLTVESLMQTLTALDLKTDFCLVTFIYKIFGEVRRDASFAFFYLEYV